MTKPMVRIHNTETDEVIDREMNATEYSQYLKDIEEIEAIKAEAEAKATARAAILDRLGLTVEEAAILLG
jgi:hypothetical protein